MNTKKISIIVPCYNEEAAITIFHRETTAVMHTLDYDYELLFINDGSADNTLSILKQLEIMDLKAYLSNRGIPMRM